MARVINCNFAEFGCVNVIMSLNSFPHRNSVLDRSSYPVSRSQRDYVYIKSPSHCPVSSRGFAHSGLSIVLSMDICALSWELTSDDPARGIFASLGCGGVAGKVPKSASARAFWKKRFLGLPAGLRACIRLDNP